MFFLHHFQNVDLNFLPWNSHLDYRRGFCVTQRRAARFIAGSKMLCLEKSFLIYCADSLPEQKAVQVAEIASPCLG